MDACLLYTSCWLCVTMTIVVPSLFSSLSRFITSCPFLLSRLPVGSSARISFGLATTARAMATRCCWPPDNCCGKCLDVYKRQHLPEPEYKTVSVPALFTKLERLLQAEPRSERVVYCDGKADKSTGKELQVYGDANLLTLALDVYKRQGDLLRPCIGPTNSRILIHLCFQQ